MRPAMVERVFRKAVKTWRPIVGLTDWQVFLTIDNKADCAAESRTRPDYQELRVTLNAVATGNDKVLYRTPRHIEYLALHELCHALTWVLAENYLQRQLPDHQASWHDENVTTKVARALWVAKYNEPPPE